MSDELIKQTIEDALALSSETVGVEFKTGEGGLPKDVRNTISSFSHRPGGGLIVFGVSESTEGGRRRLEAADVDNIAELQEQISSLCNNEMSSVIRPGYHVVRIDGKALLAVYIPECPDQFKPCYYKPAGMPNGAYVRDGNTDRKITDGEMRQMIDNARLSKFDAQKAPDTDIKDLSKEKIFNLLVQMGQRSAREVSEDEIEFDLLRNIGVADEYADGKFPTIAGFLIFSKDDPQIKREFSRYIIRCVRYKGSNVTSDIIDSADIQGTLDVQIDDMQKFILRNIRKSAEIVGTKRIDRYEYPEKAIREIVANAVIHRDYRISETYAQITIFEDRIEVSNPGCLPPGVTVENLRNAQVSRNQIIAARLKDLDYLEEYGRGIDIVFNEMGKWGLLPPIFKNTTNSFKVILPGEKLSQLNERQMKIWDYLVENKKITAKTIEGVVLGEVPRQTINYDLGKMKEIGLIHSVGESRSTYYEANF